MSQRRSNTLMRLALLPLCAAFEPSAYDTQSLTLRLRRLEAENVALSSQVAELRRSLPNCTGFVQTGGCDPDGPHELRRSCTESVPKGTCTRDSKRTACHGLYGLYHELLC
jgi:hypothetical protein